jgi:hypothetical protein
MRDAAGPWFSDNARRTAISGWPDDAARRRVLRGIALWMPRSEPCPSGLHPPFRVNGASCQQSLGLGRLLKIMAKKTKASCMYEAKRPGPQSLRDTTGKKMTKTTRTVRAISHREWPHSANRHYSLSTINSYVWSAWTPYLLKSQGQR